MRDYPTRPFSQKSLCVPVGFMAVPGPKLAIKAVCISSSAESKARLHIQPEIWPGGNPSCVTCAAYVACSLPSIITDVLTPVKVLRSQWDSPGCHPISRLRGFTPPPPLSLRASHHWSLHQCCVWTFKCNHLWKPEPLLSARWLFSSPYSFCKSVLLKHPRFAALRYFQLYSK